MVGDHRPRTAVDCAGGVDRLEQHDDRVQMLACHPLLDAHQRGLGIAGEHRGRLASATRA
jgi:hypothetical protein